MLQNLWKFMQILWKNCIKVTFSCKSTKFSLEISNIEVVGVELTEKLCEERENSKRGEPMSGLDPCPIGVDWSQVERSCPFQSSQVAVAPIQLISVEWVSDRTQVRIVDRRWLRKALQPLIHIICLLVKFVCIFFFIKNFS